MTNTIPDFLIPSGKNNRKQFFAASEGYRPLLATWLLALSLSVGWYQKAKHNETRDHHNNLVAKGNMLTTLL